MNQIYTNTFHHPLFLALLYAFADKASAYEMAFTMALLQNARVERGVIPSSN